VFWGGGVLHGPAEIGQHYRGKAKHRKGCRGADLGGGNIKEAQGMRVKLITGTMPFRLREITGGGEDSCAKYCEVCLWG